MMRLDILLCSVLSITRTSGNTLSQSLSRFRRAYEVTALPTNRIDERSAETSPSFTTYAPVRITCPENPPQVRPAHGLSEEESTWVAGRTKKVFNGLSSYLPCLHLSDFETGEYLKRLESDTSNVPNIAMVFSGGGEDGHPRLPARGLCLHLTTGLRSLVNSE